MGLDPFAVGEMIRRLDRNRKREPSPLMPINACEREGPLHKAIMAWCDSQWPRWLYIHARMDERSTIGTGINDLTIFGPFPLCLLVELKAKGGKPSEAQRDWIGEMKMLGWVVHVCFSFEEFLNIVDAERKSISPSENVVVRDHVADGAMAGGVIAPSVTP